MPVFVESGKSEHPDHDADILGVTKSLLFCGGNHFIEKHQRSGSEKIKNAIKNRVRIGRTENQSIQTKCQQNLGTRAIWGKGKYSLLLIATLENIT